MDLESMIGQHSSIVKQAVAYFKQGDFNSAKRMYLQAADQYGFKLFANNIRVCELRIGESPVYPSLATESGKSTVANDCAEDITYQLAETQKLLEQYYTKCQQMEYQLMDRMK
jgi:ATP-dependent Zn protease